jgi:hypothetical protein
VTKSRSNRCNLAKLRGYEFEEVVPWEDIIAEMNRGESGDE